jgi:hypothetical protein
VGLDFVDSEEEGHWDLWLKEFDLEQHPTQPVLAVSVLVAVVAAASPYSVEGQKLVAEVKEEQEGVAVDSVVNLGFHLLLLP